MPWRAPSGTIRDFPKRPSSRPRPRYQVKAKSVNGMDSIGTVAAAEAATQHGGRKERDRGQQRGHLIAAQRIMEHTSERRPHHLA